jgi:GDPmannose 4,6-dehydratase
MAFNELGIEISFKGENEAEIGYVSNVNTQILESLDILSCELKVGDEVVAVDPRYFRPTEVELLIGDNSKSKEKLGWVPKHDLQSLVTDMMNSDLKLMKRQLFLNKSGFNSNQTLD